MNWTDYLVEAVFILAAVGMSYRLGRLKGWEEGLRAFLSKDR